MELSLKALQERSEAVTSTGLLATISGGKENACHVVVSDPSGESHYNYLNNMASFLCLA